MEKYNIMNINGYKFGSAIISAIGYPQILSGEILGYLPNTNPVTFPSNNKMPRSPILYYLFIIVSTYTLYLDIDRH